MSRLHLLVEVMQPIWHVLSEPDQAVYAALFEPYRQGPPGQHDYRVKNDEVPVHSEEVSHLMHRLAGKLEVCHTD